MVRRKAKGRRAGYDFKRVWECPVCHRRERTGGEVVSRLCRGRRGSRPHEAVWMKLISNGPSTRLRRTAK
jgi:hypothetical protein